MDDESASDKESHSVLRQRHMEELKSKGAMTLNRKSMHEVAANTSPLMKGDNFICNNDKPLSPGESYTR